MARLALVTPSLANDFERCRLLVRSVRRYVTPRVAHYILVDRRDRGLFSTLHGDGTEVLCVEDVLPLTLRRLPWVHLCWFGLGIPPVRNWIVQQLVKLAFCARAGEPELLLVDSDVVFVRDFDLNTLWRGDRLRLLRAPLPQNTEAVRKWHRSAERLLGLAPAPPPLPSYVGNLIAWHRDNVARLLVHIEAVNGTSWASALLHRWHLSEYILYGRFVEDVLGSAAGGHFTDTTPLCRGWWNHHPMTEAEKTRFFADIAPPTVAVMISSKARMPVDTYERCVWSVDTRPES